MITCHAIIVAAGSGERMGGSMPKQYLSLAGTSILRRSIVAFLDHPLITGVTVVINPAHRDYYNAATAGLCMPPPITGGQSRQESVLNGLESLVAEYDSIAPDLVMIHDAARPLISADAITAVHNALTAGATGAIAARRVIDTLKRSDGDIITSTVDREGLWQVATPQGFQFTDIIAAHRNTVGQKLTDDAAVAEKCGHIVRLVECNPENIKITRNGDLEMATRLLDPSPALPDIRTGIGFDVHRLIAGDQIMLSGVAIPHNRRAEGHSDADVILHAVTDALLGAIGAGDIGQHFPPSDAKWKGADSAVFVRHAVQLVHDKGGTIMNVDVVLMCEQPRIGAHREAMTHRLAELLEITPDRVGIKATTTERLGFTGREEGIAAQAVATVGIR